MLHNPALTERAEMSQKSQISDPHCSFWGGIPQHDLNNDNRLHIQILQESFNCGVWNIPVKWDKVAWGMGSTKFNVSGRFASCDFDRMTRLVISSHDHGVRCEIKPCNFQYVALTMWTRGRRSARFHHIHPTIESAVAEYRKSVK